MSMSPSDEAKKVREHPRGYHQTRVRSTQQGESSWVTRPSAQHSSRYLLAHTDRCCQMPHERGLRLFPPRRRDRGIGSSCEKRLPAPRRRSVAGELQMGALPLRASSVLAQTVPFVRRRRMENQHHHRRDSCPGAGVCAGGTTGVPLTTPAAQAMQSRRSRRHLRKTRTRTRLRWFVACTGRKHIRTIFLPGSIARKTAETGLDGNGKHKRTELAAFLSQNITGQRWGYPPRVLPVEQITHPDVTRRDPPSDGAYATGPWQHRKTEDPSVSRQRVPSPEEPFSLLYTQPFPLLLSKEHRRQQIQWVALWFVAGKYGVRDEPSGCHTRSSA